MLLDKKRHFAGATRIPKLMGLALAAGATSQALAQGGVLEEITVTAQFREQDLQQTPIAITAFSAELLDARSHTGIHQVAAQAPNVTLQPNSAAYGPSMTANIRGVGQTDFNPAYEPGVGMYIDDVYYATLTGSMFDLLDLDRVEILRGPQGTLAGRNSIGGAVRLFTRKPAGDGTGSVQATYGIRDRIDLRASGDFAVTDNLSARIAGVSRRQEGYVDRIDYGCAFPESGIPAISGVPASGNCVIAREGEVNYSGARATLGWDNGGPISVLFSADYTSDDRTQSPSVLTFGNYTGAGDVNPYDVDVSLQQFVPPPGSYYNYASYNALADGTRPTRVADGRTYFRGWGFSNKLDWQLTDNLLLESITAYREYESGFSNDNDQSPLAHSFGDGYLDFWSWSQEFRLSGDFGNLMDWTTGFFWMDQESIYGSIQDLRYANLPAFWQDDPTKADTWAVFAHANWYLTEQLTVVTGLRYTDESKTYRFLRVTPEGGAHPVLGALDGQVGVYEGDRLDYRLSAQYQWGDNLMSYVQLATGFKGGGINPRPFFATQVQPFGQEKLTSYEIGTKAELFDRRVRLNGALFFSDYRDIQLTANSCPDFTPTPTGAPCAMPVNAGDADLWGIELEADMLLTDRLRMDAAVSWMDFEYRRVNPLAGAIREEFTAPYTPEWKASSGIEYEIPINGMGSLTPRLDIAYQSEVFTNAANAPTNRIGGYTLTNARLTWRSPSEDWSTALEVTNLTDKYYFMTIFDQSGNAGIASGQPGRPREWAVTIRRHF